MSVNYGRKCRIYIAIFMLFIVIVGLLLAFWNGPKCPKWRQTDVSTNFVSEKTEALSSLTTVKTVETFVDCKMWSQIRPNVCSSTRQYGHGILVVIGELLDKR